MSQPGGELDIPQSDMLSPQTFGAHDGLVYEVVKSLNLKGAIFSTGLDTNGIGSCRIAKGCR